MPFPFCLVKTVVLTCDSRVTKANGRLTDYTLAHSAFVSAAQNDYAVRRWLVWEMVIT